MHLYVCVCMYMCACLVCVCEAGQNLKTLKFHVVHTQFQCPSSTDQPQSDIIAHSRLRHVANLYLLVDA